MEADTAALDADTAALDADTAALDADTATFDAYVVVASVAIGTSDPAGPISNLSLFSLNTRS